MIEVSYNPKIDPYCISRARNRFMLEVSYMGNPLIETLLRPLSY